MQYRVLNVLGVGTRGARPPSIMLPPSLMRGGVLEPLQEEGSSLRYRDVMLMAGSWSIYVGPGGAIGGLILSLRRSSRK